MTCNNKDKNKNANKIGFDVIILIRSSHNSPDQNCVHNKYQSIFQKYTIANVIIENGS